MRLADLPTPALLLDLDVLEANLRAMAERTARLEVRLRPHFKTHKCVEIARRQENLGARGMTVATLVEAEALIEHGFHDLTWAFPLVPGRLDQLARLAVRARIAVTVDSEEAVETLDHRGLSLPVWVKVDCGYHRAGLPPASRELATLAGRLASHPRLELAGLLTHSGQAYLCRGPEALVAVAEDERQVLVEAADRLRRIGIEVPATSGGSTPALSAAATLDGVTEVRPGNYAFYDYTQTVIGSCGVRDCALTVLATVVSAPPGAEHCVVDAGALALSKDPGPEPGHGWGAIFDDYPSGLLHPDQRLIALSQEHGKVAGRLPVGTRVRILPHHSCLTAACFDAYEVVRGEEVVARWRIWRGR